MATAAPTRTPAQLFALVFGIVYLAVGVLGFALEGTDDGELFGIFGVNALHHIVHLAVGLAFVVGARQHQAAKGINTVIGVIYLVVGLLGLAGGVIVEDLINNNAADTVLHLATGALALYFGTAGAEGATGTSGAA